MGAAVAAHAFLHLSEGRVIVTIRAEGEAAALGAGGPRKQLKIIQRTF